MKYKNHTIRETKTTTTAWRFCYGRRYLAIVSLFSVEGPEVSTQGLSPLWWPTSKAAAKRMISEALGHE